MYPHPAQQLKKINNNTWVYYCRLCHSEAQRISKTERAKNAALVEQSPQNAGQICKL
jgi:hypothetical protein